MEVFVYLAVSTFEWTALMVLTFAMFKFPLRGFWGQVLLTSFVLSLFSHLVFNTLQLRVLAPLLQPPAVFLFLWQMFRIHVFYAALMTVLGYLGYTLIELLVMVLLRSSGGIPPDNLLPNSVSLYGLQLLSAALILLVSRLLYAYRIGYSFVPDSEFVQIRMQGVNIRLLLVVIIGYACIGGTSYVGYISGFPILLVVALFIALGIFMYYVQRKEHARD